MRGWFIAGFVFAALGVAQDAAAQALLWNLPEDGAWVRYEGTYRQVIRRPESPEGDLTLQWQRNLEIRSVGQEEAEHDLDHDGQTVREPCRWLEFKLVTGKIVEGIIDAGPGANVLYKVLVPESYIDGQPIDDEGIFRGYIPVVKGFRRLGDEQAQPIESGVLQCYPNLSLMRHFRNLAAAGEQSVAVPMIGSVTATTHEGSMEMETGTSRSSNAGQVWVSPDMPFGIVKWTARTVNEQKNPTAPRSEFQEMVELSEELTAVETGTGAESELVVN